MGTTVLDKIGTSSLIVLKVMKLLAVVGDQLSMSVILYLLRELQTYVEVKILLLF